MKWVLHRGLIAMHVKKKVKLYFLKKNAIYFRKSFAKKQKSALSTF